MRIKDIKAEHIALVKWSHKELTKITPGFKKKTFYCQVRFEQSIALVKMYFR